jgi:2-polyprenyl-3-methyl-5-hydroxy-6-metoxy-1,4-benzoquinol methylase
MTHAQYDDSGFFSRYQQMREQRSGLNENLEQPALARLLPQVTGADVLGIGCGDGTLARSLADHAGTRYDVTVTASESRNRPTFEAWLSAVHATLRHRPSTCYDWTHDPGGDAPSRAGGLFRSTVACSPHVLA